MSRAVIPRERAREIASHWWSVMTWNDPGVALYAFGSTGKVQSEQHRSETLDYIASCGDPAKAGNRDLKALARYIRLAPIEAA